MNEDIRELPELDIERDGLVLTLFVAYEDENGAKLPRPAGSEWVGRVVLDRDPPDWSSVKAYYLPRMEATGRRGVWLDGLSETPGRLILPYDGRWRGQDSGMAFHRLHGDRANPTASPVEIRDADSGARPYCWRPGDGTAHIVLDGFSGGSGTQGDPYIVADVDDLQAMNDDLAAHYALGGDIDASATVAWNSGAGFLPVGRTAPYFSGSLDGRGYEIQGLIIDRPTEDYGGVIGRGPPGTAGAIVSNLSLDADCSISGARHVGAIVGRTATIAGCSNAGAVAATGNNSGGICGRSGTITGCSNTGALTLDAFAGGIGGLNCDIDRCRNSGAVSGAQYLGGIGGYECDISECVNLGDVSSEAQNFVGGIGGESCAVSDCYALCDVSALGYVGGVVGAASDGRDVLDSYHVGAVSGGTRVGGVAGQIAAGREVSGCFCASTVTGTGATPTFVGAFAGENLGAIVDGYYWDHPDTAAQAVGGGAGTGTPVAVEDAEDFWDYDNAPIEGWAFGPWVGVAEGLTYPILQVTRLVDLVDVADYPAAGDVRIRTAYALGERTGTMIPVMAGEVIAVAVADVDTITITVEG